jgi:hypothetical protein
VFDIVQLEKVASEIYPCRVVIKLYNYKQARDLRAGKSRKAETAERWNQPLLPTVMPHDEDMLLNSLLRSRATQRTSFLFLFLGGGRSAAFVTALI